MSSRGLVVATAAGLLAAACAVPRAEKLFFSSEVRADPRAADCERCHQEVYREWHGSAHAEAFTRPSFRRASADTRAAACVGCHAPDPVDETAPVVARSAHVEEGVTCLSCHLATQPGVPPLTMRGPAARTSPIEIHPIILEDRFYRSSDLCGRCHELELEQWRAASDPADGSEKPTCQTCHMPSVHRKVESVHDEHAYSALFVAMGREQDLRRHQFTVPEDSGEWIGLSVEAGLRSLRIRVENGLPHALPTGAFGRRSLRVSVRWPGGGVERVVAGSREGAIEARGARAITVGLPAGVEARDVRIGLERWDRRTGSWTELLPHAAPTLRPSEADLRPGAREG